MKDMVKKIASFLLAFIVLFSTVSFTVEKHYCGRFLVDVAVFSKAKNCGMDMMNHYDDQESEVKKPSCCKDEIIVVEGQDELKTSFDQIAFPQQIFITSFFHSYISLFTISEEKNTTYKEYDPPELVRDILTLDETFLI
ncbi:HYC_CC_PP family protein [Aquimarina rubra]|uniref:Secreted protein n=1 Tax=Aquimarina rubra TaxID=1920033 RepID=A0ABW5LE10_9FLAO